MAVSKEQKALFAEKIRPYKDAAEDLKKELSTLKGAARKNTAIEPYFIFKTAVVGVQRANTLVMMSRLSQEIQNIKNDSYLNDARREITSQMGELNKLMGDLDLDESLTENQDALKKIPEVSPRQKLNLMIGMKQATDNVKTTMGDTSKWRWSFPDTYYKLTSLAKNLLDFKKYERTKDPNDEDYRSLQEYMRFMMELSQVAAQEYRSRYEWSTKDVEDLKKIQRVFEFQKKVYAFTGQKEDMERSSMSLDNVKEMIESQLAEKKEGKKKKK